ncbi:MAG: hypothetical protein JWQ25_596, partial [Daejeonella sp.]|nr:hypothetical protein [Daejeonella sp.]
MFANRKKFLIIPILLCLLIPGFLRAQINVPVDLNTGRPIINIPISTLQQGDISIPISLYYNAGGVKVDDTGSGYGLGWNITNPGSISRTVRSLPDDFQGTGTDTRKGWLYTPNSVGVRNAPLDLPGDCNGSTYNNVNSIANNGNDTEPDIFTFNCGGLSGQFVIDNDKVIQTIPFQDVKIDP